MSGVGRHHGNFYLILFFSSWWLVCKNVEDCDLVPISEEHCLTPPCITFLIGEHVTCFPPNPPGQRPAGAHSRIRLWVYTVQMKRAMKRAQCGGSFSGVPSSAALRWPCCFLLPESLLPETEHFVGLAQLWWERRALAGGLFLAPKPGATGNCCYRSFSHCSSSSITFAWLITGRRHVQKNRPPHVCLTSSV